MKILTDETEQRFWSKVNKTATCWLWTDKRGENGGYGRIHARRLDEGRSRNHYAHRIAYELLVGPIPEGLRIDHQCHTTNCVNPDHLRPVTIKQNAENMVGATRASKSGVRGVWQARSGSWTGQLTHNGIRHGIKYFPDKESAEAAMIALRNSFYTHNEIDRRNAA